MNRRFLAVFAFLLIAAGAAMMAGPAAAQPQNNFAISVGWFPTSFSTSAQLSAEDIVGTDVDLEDDLGFDNNASNIRVEGFWRFKPKHRLEFGFTNWRRTSEKEIDRDIQWGDKLFEVGGDIKAENRADFLKFAYRYSFIRTDRTEFDASIGIDAVWIKMSLEGDATITGPGGSQEQGFFKEEEDFIAPAPVLGLSITHLPSESWMLRGSAEYFQATVDNTTGKILDLRGSADWLFSQHYGVGLGYTWVGYEVERNRFDATYDFSGPLLYFTYRR